MKYYSHILIALGLLCTLLSSCACPTYVQPNLQPEPVPYTKTIKNTCYFGVQNMDEKAKVEIRGLTCHYKDFDVQYTIDKNFVISLVIMNNSNKNLIIDKSKSYVLYDGYSNQLFKDVRSSRSTTFNNVQDAINNVQTNESGVLMTIPPYAKWALPLNETNVRGITKLPALIKEPGIHSLTAFDNREVVEFVIPYSYDYSMAKWSTCRNRIFVNSINVECGKIESGNVQLWRNDIDELNKHNNNSYTTAFIDGDIPFDEEQMRIHEQNMIEANRVDEINWKRYVKHRRKVGIAHTFGGIVALPACILPAFGIWNIGCEHKPIKYGDTPPRKAPFDRHEW